MSARAFALHAWMCAGLFYGSINLVKELGYRVNESPSLPVGIWKVEPLRRTLRDGDVVSFCPPDRAVFQEARQRGYLGKGQCAGGYEPLLKPVAAVEGDRVAVTPDGIEVNGRLIERSKAQIFDRSGRRLEAIAAKSLLVVGGEIWVMSTYNVMSFDSRYFGAIRVNNVLGIARPVIVFDNRAP